MNKRRNFFMKNEKIQKIVSAGYKIGMKVLPFCAMAVAVININSTGCWVNGQPTPPETLKRYRKF